MNRSTLSEAWKSLRVGSGTRADQQLVAAPVKRVASRRLAVEHLESRTLLSASIPVTFDIPADVQSLGVWVSMSGQLTAPYESIATNAFVYYDSTTNDYVEATSSTTSSQLTFQLSGNGAQIKMPNAQIQGGQIVMGVGNAPYLTFTSGSGFSTPTAQNQNLTKIFGLFEYSIGADGSLDVDVSDVDQVGFPFTIKVSPVTGQDVTVGIAQTRADLFTLYRQFISDKPAVFQQTISPGNYRILAPGHVVDYATELYPTPIGATPVYDNGQGQLAPQTNYYYWVTATKGTGETTAVNSMQTQTDPADFHDPRLAIQVQWQPFAGATGYNVYRSLTSDLTTAQFIGKSATTSFTDDGTATPGKSLPANNYTYNPLNYYFTSELLKFFQLYTKTGSFKIALTVKTTGNNHKTYELVGQTNTALKINGSYYTVLELKSADSDPDLQGNTFRIFRPFFRNNINAPQGPPAPPGLQDPTVSPNLMVFEASGVFSSDFGLTGISQTVQLALGDAVAAAFNRGIATNTNIDPHNWASAPNVTSGGASAGGSLTNDAYYYIVTAVNANGETTPSTEYVGVINTAVSANQSVTLQWTADNSVSEYRIYRSDTSGAGYGLLTSVPNPNPLTTDPVTSFVDDGSYGKPNQSITPQIYYAPGSTSNWYAAFLHQNSTTNPVSGISIDGLAYGFSYDDQGGNSTNLQGNYTAVEIGIQPWGASQAPRHLNDPTPNIPLTIEFFRQPTSTRVGSSTTLIFKAFGPGHQTFIGGTQVTVEIVGSQKGSYVVDVNPITGLGTLTFQNAKTGFSYLRLTASGGTTYNSKVFNTLPTSIPLSLMHIFNQECERLSTIAGFYRSLDQLARAHR